MRVLFLITCKRSDPAAHTCWGSSICRKSSLLMIRESRQQSCITNVLLPPSRDTFGSMIVSVVALLSSLKRWWIFCIMWGFQLLYLLHLRVIVHSTADRRCLQWHPMTFMTLNASNENSHISRKCNAMGVTWKPTKNVSSIPSCPPT